MLYLLNLGSTCVGLDFEGPVGGLVLSSFGALGMMRESGVVRLSRYREEYVIDFHRHHGNEYVYNRIAIVWAFVIDCGSRLFVLRWLIHVSWPRLRFLLKGRC